MIQIRKPSVNKHSDLHLIERTVMSFSVNSSQDSRTCFVAVKALFPLCFKACCPSTVWFQERSAPSVPGKTGTPCHPQRLCRTKQHPMHYKKKRKRTCYLQSSMYQSVFFQSPPLFEAVSVWNNRVLMIVVRASGRWITQRQHVLVFHSPWRVRGI